jgi:hypothetical protein
MITSGAELLGKEAKIPINKESNPRKAALFQWLEEYWEMLKLFAEELKIEYEV